MAVYPDTPKHQSYDVVIVGGAMIGSSVAWFLSDNPDFQGRVLVVEKDPSYSTCSTAHTNSCIRQQFSSDINVRISQFGAQYIQNLPEYFGNDARVPSVKIQNFGYLYLADNDRFAERLRHNQKLQQNAGAGTRILSAEDIRAEYPFFNVDDILLGSLNTQDEGYWDYAVVFDWWRKSARERGVEFIHGEVVDISCNPAGTKVQSVTLANNDIISCETLVNASGPRAAVIAAMAGITLPVEPRKRFTWVISAETPLEGQLPLTIDPSGVHMRQDGKTTYMIGGHSDHDPAVDFDDFHMDHSLWQDHIWPTIATRIPQFEAVKVISEWAGHYAYNVLDQNAIVGPHTEISNFVFVNGFSGHGLQQSPAMGRGIAEWITYGEYRSLDLTPCHFDRISANRSFEELAII